MSAQRADARQNRQALLDAAAALFTADGSGVALDAVARRAGVSIATLYRHFPGREDLVTETYRHEIEQLGDVEPFLATGTGAAAMAGWVDRLVEYARTKRALAAVLDDLRVTDRPLARDTIVAALHRILARGAADGTLREDMDAEDVLTALNGLWHIPAGNGWTTRANRLASFVLAGLRPVS